MRDSLALAGNAPINRIRNNSLLCAITLAILCGCSIPIADHGTPVKQDELIQVDQLAPIDRLRLDSVSYKTLVDERLQPGHGHSAIEFRFRQGQGFCDQNPFHYKCAISAIGGAFLYSAMQVIVVAGAPILVPAALIASAAEDQQKNVAGTAGQEKVSGGKSGENGSADDGRKTRPSTTDEATKPQVLKTDTASSRPGHAPSGCNRALTDEGASYQEQRSTEIKSIVFSAGLAEQLDELHGSALRGALDETRLAGLKKPANSGSRSRVQSGLSKIVVVATKSGNEILTLCSRAVYQRNDVLPRYFEICQSGPIAKLQADDAVGNQQIIKTSLLKLGRELAQTEAKVLRGVIPFSNINAYREC